MQRASTAMDGIIMDGMNYEFRSSQVHYIFGNNFTQAPMGDVIPLQKDPPCPFCASKKPFPCARLPHILDIPRIFYRSILWMYCSKSLRIPCRGMG